jgi:hypothetical protein
LACLFACLIVFNATFNNISAISWRPVVLPENQEKTTDQPPVTDKLYHIMLYTSRWSRSELTSVVIGTNCICNCKSNYHTIVHFWLIIYVIKRERNTALSVQFLNPKEKLKKEAKCIPLAGHCTYVMECNVIESTTAPEDGTSASLFENTSVLPRCNWQFPAIDNIWRIWTLSIVNLFCFDNQTVRV